MQALSAIAAVALLAVYATWVRGYLRSDTPSPEPEREGGDTQGRGVPLRVSVALLAVAGAGAAFVSDWFIHALEPAIASLGISQAFAGMVIVAIAGNAVENVAGIVLAHKGQSDLAISVVKNSVAQVAAFLFPALVLVSLLFSHALTALALWQITGDGEATYFEGVALIALYVVLGTFAFLQ